MLIHLMPVSSKTDGRQSLVALRYLAPYPDGTSQPTDMLHRSAEYSVQPGVREHPHPITVLNAVGIDPQSVTSSAGNRTQRMCGKAKKS